MKMVEEDKVIVIDIDGTLCEIKPDEKSYLDLDPLQETLNMLKKYKKDGFYIILYTSRQMRTYKGNIGKINANTAREMFAWLDKHSVPYDEIHFGKPWCGRRGFYVDDKSVRPREYRELDYDEIIKLIDRDK